MDYIKMNFELSILLKEFVHTGSIPIKHSLWDLEELKIKFGYIKMNFELSILLKEIFSFFKSVYF